MITAPNPENNIFKKEGFMKGMNYAGFSREVFSSPESDQAIDALEKIHVNYVAINVFWYQNGPRDTSIGPHEEKTVSDQSLRHLITYLHAKNIQVLLKPMVDARDDTWRGLFKPISWIAWFRSYKRMILHYANIAQEEGIELFSVGCEYPIYWRNQWLWRRIIRKIRKVYDGALTYSANHDQKGSYQRARFWRLLDFIGIDAYFSVANTSNSTMDEMIKGWNRSIQTIEEWYKETKQKIPVLFTELGATSAEGSAVRPWEYGKSKVPNWEEQANYYEAFFKSFKERDWLKGVFWWWWDNPSTADYLPRESEEYPISYTPKGKDAERILGEYFA